MINIEFCICKELYAAGFTYKYYQEPLNYQKGMTFWYNEKEWVFGGNVLDSKSPLPDEIKNGIWLPDADYFLLWLTENDFVFTIEYNSLYRVEATDTLTNFKYRAKGANLSQALAYLIINIYRKKIRTYDNKEIMRYDLIDE